MTFLFKPIHSIGYLAIAVILLASVGSQLAAAPKPPVFDIPELKEISIDGKADDWKNQGFQVEMFSNATGKPLTDTDWDCSMQLGWDSRGLLVLMKVKDTTPSESEKIDLLWENDSIELFIAEKLGGVELYQTVFSPGYTSTQKELRHYFYDRRADAALRSKNLTVTAARSILKDGYMVEALFPWDNIGITPKRGRVIAYQSQVNNLDQSNNWHRKLWYREPANSPWNLYQLRLSSTASPTVKTASYVNLGSTVQISVVTPLSEKGKSAVLKAGTEILAQAKISSIAGDKAIALFSLPVSLNDADYKSLNMTIDQQSPTSIEVSDLASERKKMMEEAQLLFKPFIFTDEKFPLCDFDKASELKDVFGGYTFHTRFFDADYNEVNSAKKTGRYGAIVEITTGIGEKFTRYATLYRIPKKIDWEKCAAPFSTTFLSELGIDPSVASEQIQSNRDLGYQVLANTPSLAPESALILAGLSEMKAGAGPASYRASAWSRDANWWYKLKQKEGLNKKTVYFTFFPEGYDTDPNKRWPVLISLHGSGERFIKPEELRDHYFFTKMLAITKKEAPMVVVIPQCPVDEWWLPVRVNDLLDEVLAKYRIDPDRVYLNGYSMGGYGTWATAIEYPERFAAIEPICGGGDPADAARLINIPTWAFHGEKDNTVPASESKVMVDAQKAVGCDVKLTLYPELDHNCWEATFANPEALKWLLQHVRKNAQISIHK